VIILTFLCVVSHGLFNGFLLHKIGINFLTYATDVVVLMAEKWVPFLVFLLYESYNL
jgi:hypothetical protein